MVQLGFENKETLSSLEWFTAAAFLGALCCAVMGIGIKWFRAQLSFANEEIESASVQPKLGVYRSYGIDVYNPSYRVYDESSSANRFPAVKPKVKDPSSLSTIEDNRIEREPEYSEIDSEQQNVQNNNVSTTKNKKVKENSPKKAKKPNKPKKSNDPKIQSKPKTKEEKQEEARLKKINEDRIKQEKLEKKKLEKTAKEEKARLEKENKAKLEREKREKKEREKDLKNSKSNEKKIIASSDIAANVSIETTPPRPPVHNPLGTADNNYEPIRDFSSSWDMVAAHRRDLQREPQQPVETGRVMNPVMATNTLYMPTQIDRRNPVPSERMMRSTTYSNVSDHDSDKDSDTEA